MGDEERAQKEAEEALENQLADDLRDLAMPTDDDESASAHVRLLVEQLQPGERLVVTCHEAGGRRWYEVSLAERVDNPWVPPP